MRILFLSTWYPYPPDNGSKIRAYNLLLALCERHKVDLISFEFGTANAGAGAGLEEYCQKVETVAVDPFETNRSGALQKFLSLTPVVTRPIPEMRAATRQLLAHREYDAVVASGAMMARYALQTPAATMRTLEEHNSFSRLMGDRLNSAASRTQSLRYWLSWEKTKRYERRLFKQFDLVTLVSEQDRAYTEQHVSRSLERVRVVPNGVDCQWNSLHDDEGQKCGLIYNGALTYQPNLDAVQHFLSEIYPIIKAYVSDVTLKVTGTTVGVPLRKLALDDSVRLTGYVNDIRPEVASAAVCIVPLQIGGGTRLKILEAMALGTPVVATSKGAEGLDLVSGEHLFIADGPHEFARATVRLLQDRALRRELAQNARRRVEERYDWRRIGRNYRKLIEEAVVNKRREKYSSAEGKPRA